MSAYVWALAGFYPLGSLLIGALGDRFGAPSAVLFTSAACFMLTILGQIWVPHSTELE
jgi:MFS family permease